MADRPYFADAAKPSVKYYKEAMRLYSLQPSECAGVGDQIFTDILGGRHFGAKTIMTELIEPETTLFFKTKRWLEKPIIKAYSRKHKGDTL